MTATSFTADGRGAALQLQARGETLLIRFEREAWVTLVFADGSTLTARQSQPMDELLQSQAGRQWLWFEKPALTREQLAAVRSVRLESRWEIADLAGLADAAAAAPGTP